MGFSIYGNSHMGIKNWKNEDIHWSSQESQGTCLVFIPRIGVCGNWGTPKFGLIWGSSVTCMQEPQVIPHIIVSIIFLFLLYPIWCPVYPCHMIITILYPYRRSGFMPYYVTQNGDIIIYRPEINPCDTIWGFLKWGIPILPWISKAKTVGF